jgi:DNA-binding NarL/FixJ family response regulator
MFSICLLLNYVASQRMILSLYAFPTLLSAYTYGRRHATLTARERQVLHLVAQGRLNKQIAFQLGITEVTVKLHRSSVMRKMEVTSIGELIQGWNMLPSALRADPS